MDVARELDKKYQSALITGASSGIGREFARQLHESGLSVVLVARRENLLVDFAEECNRKRSGSAMVLVADLTKASGEGSCETVEMYLRENAVDILVNNAGRGSFGAFDELPLESELSMVSLNVNAPLKLTHAALGPMKSRGKGAIIMVSSVAAFQPLPFMATYAATKAFEFIFALAVRAEARENGVDILTVCPGPTATEFGGVARVPGTATGGRRDSVSTVVGDSLSALVRRRAFVVPGWRSWFLSLFSRLLPTVFTTALVRRMLLPALIHKNSEAAGSREGENS